MEALGALAVAGRHIRALSTARADSGRSGDSGLRPASPPHGSCLPVRPVARGATHASPFQSARDLFVGSATERSPSRRPVQRNSPWRTERARAAGGRSPWSPARALFERVRCCAVDRARISRSATASGPRAFKPRSRVQCCLRSTFFSQTHSLKQLLPPYYPVSVSMARSPVPCSSFRFSRASIPRSLFPVRCSLFPLPVSY
mgnify:CR=1 FL=1